MATSPAGSWKPAFPDPSPAHWVALISRPGRCEVVADHPLSRDESGQLARWLSRHAPREPDAQASYVYLGLAPGWLPLAPDGQTSAGGVTGVGSGIGFGEPDGADASTVARICDLAIKVLEQSANSDSGPR